MLIIIGCGNTNRSDDGVGVRVIHDLRRRGLPDMVRLVDAGTGGMDVMFHLEGARRVILIDAAQAGAAPGTLYRVPGEQLADLPPPGTLSLHNFRWQHALAVGRMIYKERFPTDIVVYLIQVASLDYGLELSPAARAGAEQVAALIVEEVQRDYAHAG
ncbi:MAG: hydrogenase maturation protease [Chloroflexales bacterium]|nr:hydrogenase maturation protease [Chloroflexales bacterium]